ncbi:MAG TPA: hypothetical protein PKZ05_03485 [Bacteroidales bacterium]|nr:hypothetical protein [Bacteroidales bacterium]
MTKKIICIFLLVIGGLLFLWTGYGFVKNLTPTREELIQQTRTFFDEKGMSTCFSEEQIEKIIDDSRKYGMIVSPIAMLIGAGITFGGFALFRRGRKNTQLSDPFKFD